MLTKLKELQYWLPYYFINKIHQTLLCKRSSSGTIHLMFCVVDHFEPFNGNVDDRTALSRVMEWKNKYPDFAHRHRDADNIPIQHTWFYPPHLDHKLLSYLVELCLDGYGDIEMHLHHNHMKPFPETSQSLRNKIMKCVEDYGKFGIFSQSGGKPQFAFIHGDWSLDNSGGETLCGVNDELSILKECGCYADFTFPCLTASQPAMVNRIYYAVDDREKPKSYNWGIPVKKRFTPSVQTLMLIQGILGLRIDRSKRYRFAIECSDLDAGNLPSPQRVDYWVKNALSIEGQPNWRFIKLHTHGAPEIRWDANIGLSAEIAFTYLEKNYNDGTKYCLHYVTAREMFNIIRAAEAGNDGDPHQYRNFEINPYSYKV